MRNEIIVQKMAGYAAKVIDYCKGYTYESFAADTKLVEACVFNLSQLGELCRVADDAFTAAHPEIPWRFCSPFNRKSRRRPAKRRARLFMPWPEDAA